MLIIKIGGTEMTTKFTMHILTRKECRLPLLAPQKDGHNIPKYITIHETSTGLEKQASEKNAARYIGLLENPKGDKRYGFHFLCSDNEVWQFLPTWVRTAHAGTDEGNSSIGIERLVNVYIDFDKAIMNQAKLAATLMNMYSIPIENVVPHKHWSGKECPARLLAGMYGWNWERFISTVKTYFDNKDFFEDVDVDVQ